MNHIALVEKFYQSFASQNSEGMISCYHQDIEFEDPAFGLLKKEKVGLMWKMLLERAKGDLKISYGGIKVGENTGSAHWVAKYHFGSKRRAVINNIFAKFEFKDGLIFKHTDDFNLWRWSNQALGLSGFFLGWTPYMKRKIRQRSLNLLESYIHKSEV